MANSSNQRCTLVPNVASSPLPPKFLSLMKSAGRAKFDAELFMSRIVLLTRQYSQGFDEILRQGVNETQDEVIRDIASEMDVEVSSYVAKLEDFKAKLKNEPMDQGQDDDGRSNDGPLQGNSPVGIQEVCDGMLQLQQQVRSMEDSLAFRKRFEDATVLNEERLLEITALVKELAEALESNRKLKDDMNQLPVPPVVATADESIQDENNDNPSTELALPADTHVGIIQECTLKLQQQICDMEGSNTASQKRLKDATSRNEERLLEITALKKELAKSLESNRKLKDDMNQIPVPPVVATADESIQTNVEDFHTTCAQLGAFQEDYEKVMEWYKEHQDSYVTLQEEFPEKMLDLNAKLDVFEQAYASADVSLGKTIGCKMMILWLLPLLRQFLAPSASHEASIAHG